MKAVVSSLKPCSSQTGPGGRLKTYTECTALPAFARARLPRLYERMSRVRTALVSMGSVLPTKITVEAIPASTGTLALDMTRRYERAGGPYIGRTP